MTPLQAHLICVGLVAADLIARVWRIQWIVQGLGYHMSFKDTLILNAFGDAACAVTPHRLGGEPARLAGMLRSGVPVPAAFIGISLEVLAAWPVIILAVAWLGWQYAPAWWISVGSRMGTAAREAWPWIAVVLLASLVAWYYASRVASPFTRH
ncbi:MAG TPA: lysylphosphatidylglycerol synthase domain-containing protein, partial [Gemmatimonadales bacterium]|nr:lysylphosphatidylglycerol synthase domain-containing protein [Gemmatimonadales bacterium]